MKTPKFTVLESTFLTCWTPFAMLVRPSPMSRKLQPTTLERLRKGHARDVAETTTNAMDAVPNITLMARNSRAKLPPTGLHLAVAMARVVATPMAVATA